MVDDCRKRNETYVLYYDSPDFFYYYYFFYYSYEYSPLQKKIGLLSKNALKQPRPR